MLPPGRPNEWNSGLCATFAIALQEMFGGDLWAIYRRSIDGVYHAFCIVDNVAYDADGPHDPEKLKDKTVYQHHKTLISRKVEKEWLEKRMGFIHDEKDIVRAKEFIRTFAGFFPASSLYPGGQGERNERNIDCQSEGPEHGEQVRP